MGLAVFLTARASCIFFSFTWDPAAIKRVIRSQFGDVLNVGAQRLRFPGMYEGVKIKCNSIRSSFVFSIVNVGTGKSYVMGSAQRGYIACFSQFSSFYLTLLVCGRNIFRSRAATA